MNNLEDPNSSKDKPMLGGPTTVSFTIDRDKIIDHVAKKKGEEERILKLLLSYQDTDLPDETKQAMLKYNQESASAHKYAASLNRLLHRETVGSIALDELVSSLQAMCIEYLNKLGVIPSPYTKSKTWAMWDIAKQSYFWSNPTESGDKYNIADPFNSREKQTEILDRHIGWEVYMNYHNCPEEFTKQFPNQAQIENIKNLLHKIPKTNGTLSSYDLAMLGSLCREINIDK